MCKTVGHTKADRFGKCSRCKKFLGWSINFVGYELIGMNIYNPRGVTKLRIDP